MSATRNKANQECWTRESAEKFFESSEERYELHHVNMTSAIAEDADGNFFPVVAYLSDVDEDELEFQTLVATSPTRMKLMEANEIADIHMVGESHKRDIHWDFRCTALTGSIPEKALREADKEIKMSTTGNKVKQTQTITVEINKAIMDMLNWAETELSPILRRGFMNPNVPMRPVDELAADQRAELEAMLTAMTDEQIRDTMRLLNIIEDQTDELCPKCALGIPHPLGEDGCLRTAWAGELPDPYPHTGFSTAVPAPAELDDR